MGLSCVAVADDLIKFNGVLGHFGVGKSFEDALAAAAAEGLAQRGIAHQARQTRGQFCFVVFMEQQTRVADDIWNIA